MTASHVLIRGHIFTSAEKAPFVPSGVSVLGALEYDRSNGRVKCHECGEWRKGLGRHIIQHGLKRREYNTKHGLRINSALSSLSTRKKHAAAARRQNSAGNGLGIHLRPGSNQRRTPTTGRGPAPHSAELLNERGECAAQSLFRLQVLAAQKQHTPTESDLREAGIRTSVFVKHFGSMGRALEILGLNANHKGQRQPNPIPPEVSKRWEERMPWPEDYSRVNPLERRKA